MYAKIGSLPEALLAYGISQLNWNWRCPEAFNSVN